MYLGSKTAFICVFKFQKHTSENFEMILYMIIAEQNTRQICLSY